MFWAVQPSGSGNKQQYWRNINIFYFYGFGMGMVQLVPEPFFFFSPINGRRDLLNLAWVRKKWLFYFSYSLLNVIFYRLGNVLSAHSSQTETKFSLFHLKVNWPNHLYQLKLSRKAKKNVISLRTTEKHSQITEQKCESFVWKKEDTALTRTVGSLCWFLFLQWWPW